MFDDDEPPRSLVSSEIKFGGKIGNIPVEKFWKGGIAIAIEFSELETAGNSLFFDSLQELPIPKPFFCQIQAVGN